MGLLIYAHQQGYELTLGDGSIDQRRSAITSRGKEKVLDAQHKLDGNHYRRLAQDLNLFIDGLFISDGAHPAWLDLGTFWKGLHSLCRWGGDFQGGDSNHFSLEHNGVA